VLWGKTGYIAVQHVGHLQGNMLCFPTPGLENDTSSSSKTHTWWSAGWSGFKHRLFYSSPDEVFDLEKAPEAPDGSKFVGEQLASKIAQAMLAFLILLGSHFSRVCVNFILATTLRPDAGLHLATVGVVPFWWAFKFQEDEVLRGYSSVFDTDSLDNCFLHYFRNGTCYQIVVGWYVFVSHKAESECPIFGGMDGEDYIYQNSLYGTQIYRSHNSCSSSLTASREFQFEIADLRSQNAASLASASSVVVGGCRTTLRLALDMPKVDCHGIH